MKKARLVALVVVCVPLGSAALTAGVRYAWDHWVGDTPRLVGPRALDLGEQRRGEIVVGRFQVKNAGSGVLHLEQFQTSCSCAGVEREIDGHLSRLQALDLSSGEVAELTVRVGVGARPGQYQHVQVFFASNDPSHPSWQMDVLIPRVTGGYFAEPSAVLLGPLSVGAKSSRTIDLYDNGMATRKVEKVYATHPEHFNVTLLTLSKEEKQRIHPTAGKLFARIEVTPHCDRPGHINGEVHVELAGEKFSEPIPVVGEVHGLVECRPEMLVLPRWAEGRSIHAGQVLLLNRREQPIEVVVDSLPPEIVAEVRVVPGCPEQRLLHVEWRPAEDPKKRPASPVRIRLRVRSEGQNAELEVPISLTEKQS